MSEGGVCCGTPGSRGLVAHALATYPGLRERLDHLRGRGKFVLAVHVDDVEHIDGDAGHRADLADRLLPCLRRSQLVQLCLQTVSLLGFLMIGFGEFLPFAGLRLPINRRVRGAVRLPASTGDRDGACCGAAPCMGSCCLGSC